VVPEATRTFGLRVERLNLKIEIEIGIPIGIDLEIAIGVGIEIEPRCHDQGDCAGNPCVGAEGDRRSDGPTKAAIIDRTLNNPNATAPEGERRSRR
jgi:hypothetical protein